MVVTFAPSEMDCAVTLSSVPVFWNADAPMVVTPLPIITLANLVAPLNRLGLTTVT